MTIVSFRQADEPVSGDADVELVVGRNRDLRARLTELGSVVTALPAAALDLLTIAITAYAADKVVLPNNS